MAAIDTMLQECAGENGLSKSITDGLTVHLSPEELREIESEVGHSPGNPIDNENELEEAIQSCMEGKVATRWAYSIVGRDAPEEAVERTKKVFCKGLYT